MPLFDDLPLIDLGSKRHTRSVTAPANPAAGDTWDELDSVLGIVQTWVWSGFYWLSLQLYQVGSPDVNVNAQPLTFAGLGKALPYNLFLRQWLLSIRTCNTGGVHDASNYHNFKLYRVGVTGGRTEIASLPTQGLGVQMQTHLIQTLNLHLDLDATNTNRFDWGNVNTGTPTNSVQNHAILTYRYARK